jgi:hypothetical protein
MNTKVVLKDVGLRVNGAKVHATRKYSHACLKTKLQRKHL